ncbi:MAG: AAA family ATPase [Acidimicrobiales bacterium]|jgi:hypothetical protein
MSAVDTDREARVLGSLKAEARRLRDAGDLEVASDLDNMVAAREMRAGHEPDAAAADRQRADAGADPETGAAFEKLTAELPAHRNGSAASSADAPPRDPDGEEVREPTTWTPVDLTDALNRVDVEPPTLLARSDGMCMLYPGRTHAFQGESESCKSWAAQLAGKQEILAGHDVLYVDYEDDAPGVVARFFALGLTAEQIGAHLVYIRPDEPLNGRHGEATPASSDLLDAFKGRTFTLCIIDGVTEAMTTEGLGMLDNTDIAVWMRRLPRRIARTGAAVVVVDHLPKDRMNQGRYAIGGQHKLAGLTGAAYKFTLTKWFTRATGSEPVDGRVLITVEKDRPGYVRGRADDGKVGVLHLTSYPDGGVSAAVEPPTIGATTDRKLVDRILGWLTTYDGSSKNAIENAIEAKASRVRDALAWMVEEGWVSVERKGNGHLHWLTDIGRSEGSGTRDEVDHGIF